MRLLFVTLFILSVKITPTVSSGWWMDQPYSDSEEFNERAEYEENVTLTCGDIGGEIKHWVRPDMTVMLKNTSDYFQALYFSPGWEVDIEGAMHIIFVQEEHFGFYYCAIDTGPDYVYVKKALNYKGPFFGNLWDTYEMNFIVGFSAAGGFLLACLIIFVVHHFFFSSENPEYNPDNSRIAVELADDYSGLKISNGDPPFYSQNSEMSSARAGVENGGYRGEKEGKDDDEAYTQL